MLTELYQAYAKFTLRLSLAFSYIGRLTARHLRCTWRSQVPCSKSANIGERKT